jgi:hypothetical protein
LKQAIAAFAALLALGVGSASAQSYSYGPGYYGARPYDPGLPPPEIIRIVRAAGFSPMNGMMRRGRFFVIPAVANDGGQVRVIVDAYAGDIVRVRPMLAYGPYGAPPPYDPRSAGVPPSYDPRIAGVPPGYGEPPPNYGPGVPGRDHAPGATGDDYAPGAGTQRATPPAHATPNPKLANVPPVIPPVARTPIPRPRPNVATVAAPPADTGTPAAPAAPAKSNGTAGGTSEVPEAPPAPIKTKPATPLVPVAPLD